MPRGELHYLDMGALPEAMLAQPGHAPDWAERAAKRSSPPPAGALAEAAPIPFFPVQLERVCGLSLYMSLMWVPGLSGLLFALYLLGVAPLWPTFGVYLYIVVIYLGWRVLQASQGWRYDITRGGPGMAPQKSFHQFTVRNTIRYFGVTVVYPSSLADPVANATAPTIFCMVPHGVLPLGVYTPFFNSMFGRFCTWTTAPVLFRLPFVRHLMRHYGATPAKAQRIRQALTTEGRNVGIILDGILGMFTQGASGEERVAVSGRKALSAIALQSGARVVPVYVFGHTDIWRPVVDPWGILKWVSVRMNVSLVPFLGRWGWPMGPAKRRPLLVALGDPIDATPVAGERPSQEEIEQHHGRMVDGFRRVFDLHKASYGWADRSLKVV